MKMLNIPLNPALTNCSMAEKSDLTDKLPEIWRGEFLAVFWAGRSL
jgi:hypothetical protein